MSSYQRAVARVAPLDAAAGEAALARLDRLTKPAGSLGRLELTAVQLALISGECPPPVPEPATVAVFAGDHGVVAQGVTPWPSAVTGQMVANFCAGGAAINVLARHAGADVVVVDVGVASDVPDAPGLVRARVAPGTADLTARPAMTADECRAALDVGAGVAEDAVTAGARCLVTGDMGIGNTTPSAALIAAFTGLPAATVTGRGTGIDDAMLDHKIEMIEKALARHAAAEQSDQPADVLAGLGGFEIAAIAGFITGGAAARVPVVVDGVVALAALLAAHGLEPRVLGYCIAGHRSVEPGASAALDFLGLHPLLDLDLRLGEGTGACLALPIVQAAARIIGEMATFEDAGVSER